MNLNELRLRALLSLKKALPLPPALPDTTTDKVSVDKEEGELSEYSEIEKSSESASESESDYAESESEDLRGRLHDSKARLKRNFKNVHFSNGPHKKTKYSWTRQQYHKHQSFIPNEIDPYATEPLDNLKAFQTSLLQQLDENQALLAASEDHEQDLLVQLEECRYLQKSCEVERRKLERKMELLLKTIRKKETMEHDLNKKVNSTNFKSYFVGKMLKDSYCKSIGTQFIYSNLFKDYSHVLKIDLASPSFNHLKIDPQTPFCLTELIDGTCPFRTHSCTLQHVESLRYGSVRQVLQNYRTSIVCNNNETDDPYELIRRILEES